MVFFILMKGTLDEVTLRLIKHLEPEFVASVSGHCFSSDGIIDISDLEQADFTQSTLLGKLQQRFNGKVDGLREGLSLFYRTICSLVTERACLQLGIQIIGRTYDKEGFGFILSSDLRYHQPFEIEHQQFGYTFRAQPKGCVNDGKLVFKIRVPHPYDLLRSLLNDSEEQHQSYSRIVAMLYITRLNRDMIMNGYVANDVLVIVETDDFGLPTRIHVDRRYLTAKGQTFGGLLGVTDNLNSVTQFTVPCSSGKYLQ